MTTKAEVAETNLRDLQAELGRLRQHKTDLKAQAAVVQHEIAENSSKRQRLRLQSDALVESRLIAGEQVGRITKRQLSEIKQLVRSPPDVIRRTLVALWILLHSGRFEGKACVQFDEAKDWPRCQRMLTDDQFVNNILNFDTEKLMKVPHVIRHIATQFFGLSDVSGEPSERPARDVPVTLPPLTPPRQSSPGAVAAANTPELPQLPGVRRCQTSRRTSAGSESAAVVASRCTMRRSVTAVAVVKQPLDVETVSFASEPCGALALWMIELIHEYLEGQRLRSEIGTVEVLLSDAEERLAWLEADMSEAEAQMARKREQEEEQTRALRKLAAEEAEVPKPKPKPSPKRERTPKFDAPPPIIVEIDLAGTMAHIESSLSSMKVEFANSSAEVFAASVPEQAIVLPKIAEIVKESRGSLKLKLEAHRKDGERDGLDLERSLGVFAWLVQFAGVPPGLLRVSGCSASQGMGCCLVPVPIHELFASSGPVPAEVKGVAPSAKPGLYFPGFASYLGPETRTIITKMAEWLVDDGDTVVLVEGHTDQQEPDDLGLERARAVREVLVGLGVRSSRVKMQSCKHLFPLSRTKDALNRRVELHAV
eukprot:TRINITY_DN67105_c0_g1_i1.p1 TRINITY_DN67105_c0_g1~~TRINITY_DN67105_c0_g1_i1.p1  ORF type:complete len:595 (-),score=108.52 TRINITY_DN67105_c0_g1_i1:475-2259(-)